MKVVDADKDWLISKDSKALSLDLSVWVSQYFDDKKDNSISSNQNMKYVNSYHVQKSNSLKNLEPLKPIDQNPYAS